CRDPEPARSMDAQRQHAVRPRPALFAFTDHRAIAADLVHPNRLGRGAVHAARRGRLVFALGAGVGTCGRCVVAALCGRPHRGSHQAGLSRDPRAPRTDAPDSGAQTGAGAVIDSDERISRRPDAPWIATRLLFVARIGVFARSGLLRLRNPAVGPWAMRTSPAPRITLAAAFKAVATAIDLRLRTGDERGQAVDAAAIVRDHRLGLLLRFRLILRLRPVLALAMFTRLIAMFA